MDNKLIAAIFVLCFLIVTTSVTGRILKQRVDVNEMPSVNTDNENPTPIVGVLSQEVSAFMLRKYPNDTFTSYIAASYVKFVEGAGARVVPIW